MIRSEIKIQTLWNKVSEYEKFVFYGAGDIAKVYMEVLKERNYQPLYCVVSDISKNPKELNGVPVHGFCEVAEELRESGILVFISSLSVNSNKKIFDMLISHGITNILSASSFCFPVMNGDIFWNIYIEKGCEWYIRGVESWCLEQYGIPLEETLGNSRENGDRNKILFVVDNFGARTVKIAKALKTYGKEVFILLDGKGKSDPIWVSLCNILDKEGIGYSFYGPIEELLFLILKNKGNIVHVFSSPWTPYISYTLVKLQDIVGKIVFENYDIANGFHVMADERMLELEKYCIENAKGICHREYSLEYLIDVLYFEIKGKTIRFLDYCSDRKYNINKKNKDIELSLCYVGGIEPKEEFPDTPFEHLEFASLCEENKCHFHIYPPDWDEKRYGEYIRKDEECLYFHFHKPVPNDMLAEEISKYDYGVSPIRDDVWENARSGQYTKEKLIYAGANKLFDYLDAGLPIVTAIPQKISKYLEEKGVLINWTNGQYDFDYLRDRKESMREKVSDVREELRIGNHIQELVGFYESL